MTNRISSIEDESSIIYRGRAFGGDFAQNSPMADSEWRARLADALAKSGKSKRSVSLDSGNGPGYMHSILAEGKDPTIENLMKICETLGVSIIYILHGIEVGKAETELLTAIRNNPEKREAILSLVRPPSPSA